MLTMTDTHTSTATVLPHFNALKLEIRTRWRRPNVIPGPFLANILRGALGITLRKLVCPEGWHDHACPPCPLYASCAYGQVFVPTPPEDATALRLQQDLPRPFIIEPPGLDPDDRVTPDGLTFRLMLFGRAMNELPYFISTLDRLGHDGMGRDRVPFDLERITACHPQGDEVLYTGGSTTVRLPQRTISTADIITRDWPTEALPPPDASALRQRMHARLGLADTPVADRPFDPARPRLKLRFVTPLLLKSGSGLSPDGQRIPAEEVRDRPPFGVILRRLRDRASALCTFFSEPWRHPDFASLGTLADTVNLVESRTEWLTRDRRSTRTGQHHDIGGLLGHALYEFPDHDTLTTLAPLLKLAEFLHVGKHAAWGNGSVRITQIQ